MKRGFVVALLLAAAVTVCAAVATHITTSSTLPTSCLVGDLYYKTGTSAGLYACTATNTWTLPAGTPGGSTTQMQYNNAGAFGGVSNGTSGQVLTSNGAGVTPSFQATGSPVFGFNTDLLSSAKLGGKTFSAKTEYLAFGSSSTVTLLDYTGGSPGYIDSMFIAIASTTDAVWRDAVVNVYVDGAGSPYLSVGVWYLMGAAYVSGTGTVKAFNAKYIGVNSAADQKGYFFNIPVPFATGVKITLTNASASTGTVFSVISYKTGIANTWNRTRQLQVAYGTGDAAPNSAVTFVDIAGKGRVVGMWQLVDGFPGSNSPRLASLEGNIKFYIDSDVAPTYESSGTEDYYLQGFYFANAATPTNTPIVGVTWKDTNAIGAYRFHIDDPWTFDTHLKITWNAGDTSQVSFTGNVRYYYTVWYYTE